MLPMEGKTAMTASPAGTVTELSQERRDLLQTLDTHRGFLRKTADGLSDEQANTRSTVSALTVGGLTRIHE